MKTIPYFFIATSLHPKSYKYGGPKAGNYDQHKTYKP